MLELTSEILLIKKINKKTTAKVFKDIKVGDIIQIKTNISPTGHYVKYLQISVNGGPWQNTPHTFNTISNYIRCFQYEEL